MSGYSAQDLYQSILELKIIDESVLATLLKESQTSGKPLGEILLDKDLINENSLGKIIGDLINVPFIDLANISIEKQVLLTVPETVARKQQIVAFKIDDKTLSLATTDPSNQQILEFLAKKTGLEVKVYYSTLGKIKKVLNLYNKDITKAYDDLIAENVKEAKGRGASDPLIIKIVSTLIDYAYQSGASDIHIEPLEKETLVRFRVDGVLRDVIKLPSELNDQIVTRVKVMADLRTDEHQEAQDGKIVYKLESEELDLRVSIAPITKGEKVVMRLLSETSRQFSLADLGLPASDLKKVENAYHSPHGMILSTGPTGSGKTTSLYSILKLINKRDINIMTIEDPVEYQIENVNQIQVNNKTGLTFAKGLRSIVRQDPDVILVGEIRDNETADIAVNSAMTGHLVLSTLHTNNAVTSFPRLIDMGVEPYLISSTVNVVIAQRLVRKICSQCRVSKEIKVADLDTETQKYFSGQEKILVYQGKGCAVCHQSGYIGRIGIFEVLVMNDEFSQAVIAKRSTQVLQEIAVKNGMQTMLSDGIEKVRQGVTTIEELLRVTKD